MTQLTIIYIIVFCAVLLAVQAAYWVFSEQQKTRGAINRRLALAKQGAHAQEIFEALRRERGLVGVDYKHLSRLNDLVVQTGLRLDQKLLLSAGFCLSILFFVLFGLAFGYGLIAFLLAALFSALSILLFLMVVRRNRITKFSGQLPDAIDVIVRGVKSGYPFTVALALVGKEMSDPIGTEFGMTSDEIGFGSEIGAALDNLYYRVGHEDLLYLTMAIKVQNQTGGNLAEILSGLAQLLRDRQMLRLKVRALSAEGRLSAIFLTVMPFALFGAICLAKPDFYFSPEVLGHPIIMPMFVLALIMLAAGNLVIYRMVNFKV